MLVLNHLPSGRTFSRAVIGAALLTSVTVSGVALAASCPSVSDPQGINTSAPYQLDLGDYNKQTGKMLALNENPLFADQVKAGTLPPVAERLPEDALVYLPYDDCGKYGGMLRGIFAVRWWCPPSPVASCRECVSGYTT